LAGAMIGTMVGLRWLSQTTTRYLLAAILCAAGIQLLVFWGRSIAWNVRRPFVGVGFRVSKQFRLRIYDDA
jgi:hypothetical protein